MDGVEAAGRARQPEDLDRLFLERANAGDVDGVVDLYEPDAVLAFPPGRLANGRSAIREVYADLLANRPRLTGEIRPAIRNGDIAITPTVRAGNATVEVARRQPDGTWLWLIEGCAAVNRHGRRVPAKVSPRQPRGPRVPVR